MIGARAYDLFAMRALERVRFTFVLLRLFHRGFISKHTSEVQLATSTPRFASQSRSVQPTINERRPSSACQWVVRGESDFA